MDELQQQEVIHHQRAIPLCGEEDDSCQGLAGVRALTGSLPEVLFSEAKRLFLLSSAGTERANRGKVSPRDAS